MGQAGSTGRSQDRSLMVAALMSGFAPACEKIVRRATELGVQFYRELEEDSYVRFFPVRINSLGAMVIQAS